MSPKEWGPPAWRFIRMSIIHGEEDLAHELLMSLPQVLPCRVCRKHTQNYIRDNPPPSKRNGMLIWLQKFKNNQKQRKNRKNKTP